MPTPRKFPPAPEPEHSVSYRWFVAYVAVPLLLLIAAALDAVAGPCP